MAQVTGQFQSSRMDWLRLPFFWHHSSNSIPSMVGFILRLGSFLVRKRRSRSSRTYIYLEVMKRERERISGTPTISQNSWVYSDWINLSHVLSINGPLGAHPTSWGQGQSPNNFLPHSVGRKAMTSVSELGDHRALSFKRWNSAAWHFENKSFCRREQMRQGPEWPGRALRRLLLLREIIHNLENDSVNFLCFAEVCLTSLAEDRRFSGGKETWLAKG